jgi:hypothetical protein
MVEERGVAADETFALEAVDATLGGRRREADEPADLAGGPASVLDEDFDDAAIGGVEIRRRHEQILTPIVGWRSDLNDIGANNVE